MEDGSCMFDKVCRKSMVVYELKCKCCNKDYIDKTQRTIKDGTKEHINDVWKIIESGRKSLAQTGLATVDITDLVHFQNTSQTTAENARIPTK